MLEEILKPPSAQERDFAGNGWGQEALTWTRWARPPRYRGVHGGVGDTGFGEVTQVGDAIEREPRVDSGKSFD